MRIIDKYILFRILSIFITTVLIFCTLYILVDTTSQLDEFIERKVGVKILVEYYANFFPTILVQTSSIACLISVLLTFSSLNNSNEIIVLRTGGMNFWKITKSALFFGLMISVLIFWVNEKILPQANNRTKTIRSEQMESDDYKRRKAKSLKNLTFYGLKNRLFFIDNFDPKTSELKGITIIEHDENQNIKEKIVAFKGIWTGIAWKFFQCQVTTFDPNAINRPIKIKVYNEKLMDIKETPKHFLKQKIEISTMNIKELKEYIVKFSNSGATKAINNLQVDLHQKIAYPFGNFVIILVGLPFSLIMKNRKGTTFTSLGMAIAIGFFYYIANAVAIAIGKGGLFPPMLAAWTAPIIFIGVAIVTIEMNN